jgi:Protein of unknown function (DUF1592)/Protein of unknown function (DUF1588)/Protein of unknown function (DUF1587)/Protein of unknown function (DUF1585)/Protein of unknown function (DUF1595)
MSTRPAALTPPPPHRRPGAITLALALALTGCSGTIMGDAGSNSSTPGVGDKPSGGSNPGQTGGSGSSAGSPGDPSTGAPLPPPGASPLAPPREGACEKVNPGPAPVRRLTRTEYDNTVRDLLGEDKGLAKNFPKEELQHSFDNSADLRSVSDVLAENYTSAAATIGKTVVEKMGTFLACDAAKEGDDTCLNKFFDGFGKRLWRRPLSTTEREDLKKVFTAGKMTGFADGLDAVVQVMVLSPQFMYRLERGVPVDGAGYSRLTHWEMASRLSYLLWGTMPDDQLFTAAEAGKLGTREEVSAQAKRMLEDPRATAMITNFAGQWLQLRELAEADKDTDIYPQWKDELPDLFRKETEEFIASVWKGDAKLDSLLSSNYTMMNGPLAAFYGVKNVTGDAFQKVNLDGTQRAGILTHAGIMAAKAGPDQSSPILRGVFVREQLFCQELPPPPPTANAEPPMLNNKMTTKERFAAHRNDPSCEGCHKLIDYIGFGFEKYDATGAWRTMESGKVVDATGELVGTDVDGKFDGALEMTKKLTESKAVETCMAKHWFHFGFGRGETEIDACTAETLAANFTKTGGDLRQLLLTLVQTDAFFFKGGLQ